MATFVPMWSALASVWPSVDEPPLTRNEPTIEANIPTKAMNIGKNSSESAPSAMSLSAINERLKAVRATGAMIDPA